MSKTNIPNSKANLIDDDTQYEVVPRRHSDRRSDNKRQDFAPESDDIKVQKMDSEQAGSLIESERRQADRRTSRPTLLSVDEIAKLREK